MSIVGTAKQIATTSANIQAGGHRTRETTYLVITDSASDGTVAVQGAPGLPPIGTTYGELDTKCVVVALVPERISRYVWHVTAVYSTEYESITNILAEPPEVEYGSEPSEEPMIGYPASISYPPPDRPITDNPNDPVILGTFKGKGIVNSAGNLYDPPASRRLTTPIVRISRNEPGSAFTLARKVRFENTVNKFAWNGLQSRMAWCREYSAQAMYFIPPEYGLNHTLYYRVKYEFALKYETWDLILPDAGPYYLEYTGASSVRKPFLTPEGTPYVGLLDHSDKDHPGKRLPANSECQYCIGRKYREENFNELGIDLNLFVTSVFPTHRGYRPFPDGSKTPLSAA